MCVIIAGCISAIMAWEAFRWATSSLMTAAIGFSRASTLDPLAAFISATSLSREVSIAATLSCISCFLSIMAWHSAFMSVSCLALSTRALWWAVLGAGWVAVAAWGVAAGGGVWAPALTASASAAAATMPGTRILIGWVFI